MPLSGSPSSPKPPAIIPPVKQVDVSKGRRAGEAERRRVRGGRGRAGTILAGRRQLAPAAVSGAALRQRLGGT